MSLVETLVVAALSLLLLGLVVRLLWPVSRASARASAKIELQQSAHRVANSLARTAAGCNAGGASLLASTGESPAGAGFQQIDGLTSSGFQIWSDEFILYFWYPDSRLLYHQNWPPEPPDLGFSPIASRPSPLTPAQLRSIATEPNNTQRLLAQNVDSLSLRFSATGNLEFHLELSTQYAPNAVERYELNRVLAFRN